MNPFFVIGYPRSGTTMLRLMLNNHPNLAVPFESGFIPIFYKKLKHYGDLSRKENVAKLLQEISENHFVVRGGLIRDPQAILDRSDSIANYADLVNAIFTVFAEQKGKQRWGDKSPDHVMELDVLWKLFPGCRFVHLVRDGRDVALSLATIEWGGKHLPSVAQDWCWTNLMVHKMGALLGEHYLRVRYEDLVFNTEDVLRTICTFLQEPYQADMLTYHQTAKEEMPAVSLQWHSNSVSPPDASKVLMWKQKMSRSDRIIFEQVAGSGLELFGYDREHHPSTWGSRVKNLYYGTVRRY